MFHKIIIFILLSCILSTYFTRDFVVISFAMNQEKIAQTMCVNKDKPWMHCNGRCFLMKKVKQAEENEKKQANKDFRSSLQLVWFIKSSNTEGNVPQKNHPSKQNLSHYRYTYSNQYNASIFRPPKSFYFI